MIELENFVKELVEGYVVSEKKPETVEEYLEKYKIEDLSDVKPINGLASLLRTENSRTELRRELFHKGYLTDVPVSKVIESSSSRHGNPYLNPNVVGENKVEEHQQIIINSQEFKDYINQKYSSLCDVGKSTRLVSLLGVKNITNINEIRRRLFQNEFLTDIPISKVIKSFSSRLVNPYLNSEIVGDNKVEEHRKKVIESEEFKDYVNLKYHSLYGIIRNQGLAFFLGVNPQSTVAIRKALFDLGHLIDVPIDKIIEEFNNHKLFSPYFNPDVVGEEKADEHRELVLRSQEFSDYINDNYNYLSDIKKKSFRGLATILGVKNKTIINELRRELLKRGFLTDVPVDEIIKSISSPGRNLYLSSEIFGEEKVEEHRELVLQSQEFSDYINDNYNHLSDIIDNNNYGLASLLNVPRITGVIRQALFKRGFLTKVSIEEIIKSISSPGTNFYLSSEIFDEEKVEEHRKSVLQSQEFSDYVNDNYNSLCDLTKDNSSGLASLLGVPRSIVAIRQALFDFDFLTELPLKESIESIEGNQVNPYLDPNIVGEEMVEHYREIILSSEEFRDYIENKYDSLHDVGINIALTSILKVSPKMNPLKRELFNRGMLRKMPIKKILDKKTKSYPYFNAEIVGNKAEEYREELLTSDEFKAFVHDRYSSLNEIGSSRTMATLLNVGTTSIIAIRQALFKRGFLTDIPIDEIIKSVSMPGTNFYLSSEAFGEEKVEEHCELVLQSQEFSDYVNDNYNSLYDVTNNKGLASLLGVPKTVSAIRQALVERGFFAEEFSDVVQDLMESYVHD